MNQIISSAQKGSPWGWWALGLCLPVYIIIIGIKFDWIVPVSGLSVLLYIGYILAGVGIPILVLIQGIRIFRFLGFKDPSNPPRPYFVCANLVPLWSCTVVRCKPSSVTILEKYCTWKFRFRFYRRGLSRRPRSFCFIKRTQNH